MSLLIGAETLKRFAEHAGRTAGETQLQRYRRLAAIPEILEIIGLGGGPAMGTRCERLLRFSFPALQPRESKKASGTNNSGYDHRIQNSSSDWKKLEQKTSGLWSDEENSFRWQHIEADHPWEGLLLVGLQTNGVSAWGMRRADFTRMVTEGKATNQGNKTGDSSEGVWMLYKNVAAACVPLTTESDLQAFVDTL